ncbi:PH domain-containing protein [Jatrophihabitans fulvus]
MDDISRRTSVRFVPDRRLTGLAAGGAVVAALLALLATDDPSRLLFAVAVVVLLAFALSDLVFSPRLEADAAGVRVRSPLARAWLPWSQIDAVRLDERPRLGRRSVTLEVDAGETLIVLSRRALGTEPEDALALVNAFRPPRTDPRVS